MEIQLINHACVKIRAGDVTLLCDPWLEGSAFNDGWDLLIKRKVDTDELLADVDFIWLSHEHPDHFSPRFFSAVPERFKQKIQILFQRTKDRRVADFLKKNGFDVIERDGELPLGDDVVAKITPFNFYDSMLYVRDSTCKVLNLNDCAARSSADILKIRKGHGDVDVLLTQFSYAAWKGGKENRTFRKDAAREKLQTVKLQADLLGARYVIPFASFIYFSNEENSYLNDSINTHNDVIAALADSRARTVVLAPGATWRSQAPAEDMGASVHALNEAYANVPRLPLRQPAPSVGLDKLFEEFGRYMTRLEAVNSKLMIHALSRMGALKFFQPIRIRLTDLDKIVEVAVTGISIVEEPQWDVCMHSTSLSYVFSHPFGFDTLTVNGRFEASAGGFQKMVKFFGLGSLNSMGLRLDFSIVKNFDVALLFGRKLRGVLARLSWNEL